MVNRTHISELDERELLNRLKYLQVLQEHKLDDLFFKNMKSCKEFLIHLINKIK